MPRVVEQKRESVVADSFTEVATMARKPCGMPVKDIKSEIRKRFGSLSGVSDQIGMARNGISNILSQPGYSISGEQKVAKLLGREPYEIWPDRYHADGLLFLGLLIVSLQTRSLLIFLKMELQHERQEDQTD